MSKKLTLSLVANKFVKGEGKYLFSLGHPLAQVEDTKTYLLDILKETHLSSMYINSIYVLEGILQVSKQYGDLELTYIIQNENWIRKEVTLREFIDFINPKVSFSS